MQNFDNLQNTARRYMAHVSQLGTTQLHLRNPYIIAWWSAAFPGFGHLLLSKNIRGLLLFVWEIVINVESKLNLGMVYTFMGEFDKARQVIDPHWILLYISVYIFAIWDSYRTTVDINRISILAIRENHRFNTFSMGAMELNYLDKRNPRMAVIWSFLMPGTGQLYLNRIIGGFFVITWMIVICLNAHFNEAMLYLFMGDLHKANAVVNKQWLLFLPSIYGYSIYDAYLGTVENNKLFIREQSNWLKKMYQHPEFQVEMPE
ncbi:hypothetical protein ACFO4N_00305 [Camelliibacillus cellulosilyticus]|uniref:Uncharacterized protein n=1 Tax=Camelliibacillus cellulosilyticus TaxID=2174486 RepID=A0ABV9GGQ2_9BACL